MKKNLRIVSVAAAALLAVAPVATGVVPVSGVNTVQAGSNAKSTKTANLSTNILSINNSVKVSDITPSWVQNNVKLSSGLIAGVESVVIKDGDNTVTSKDSLQGGKTYTLQVAANLNGLTGYNSVTVNKSSAVDVNGGGVSKTVTFDVSMHVYDPNAAGIPQFILNNNGSILNNNAIAPLADGLSVTNGETIDNIIKAAEGVVTFRDTMNNDVNNAQIITTPSDVINELKQQGVTVNGNDGSAKVTAASGFNVTLTGRTLTNGKTATVKIPFVPAGSVQTDAPEIQVAVKAMGQSTFGTATKAANNQYYQIASGSNFNPLDFTTSNGDEIKFSAIQSNKNSQAAEITATSNPVNTSEAGKFYHVTLTATNNGKKTSTYSYTVLVVSNGLQELYADAKTYNIYGDNVQATGNTIAKGNKVYVGNDTKTIGNVSYSKVSTQSKAAADAGNTWIETSALAKPAGDTNVATHTIMVNSRAYDKNGNYLGKDYYAYNSIDIVPEVVTIKGKTYYKVANKDEYVRVTNITGNKRKLRHNAYVYWSSNRRTPGARKMYKGETVTTYGGKMTFKNGKKYYRIEGCRNNNKRYIKAANF
ncbi:hypothetical protein GCM10022297_02750 [Lactobacillus hamsteri]|uniref:SlpX n=1 Tax=Lactobacillus hamsteri DSM 5661 = JCM 6256 TaxID=1423754 RepID=A0A0R1YK00_9LACO|nr:SLAP domain-containing protein [Lactobacillus hamsteri]KRM40267.1 SlpX [Lactobacillus hamsteri DSM 5661 = JCM 6256]